MWCSYFALSRWERFLGFLLCIGGAAACFAVSFFIGLPMLAIKPRKFAVSFSLGSVRPLPFLPSRSWSRFLRLKETDDGCSRCCDVQVLFMVGFAVLQGPVAHLKHIFTPDRLPFTLAYFGSLILTLFFALVASSLFLPSCSSRFFSLREREGLVST